MKYCLLLLLITSCAKNANKEEIPSFRTPLNQFSKTENQSLADLKATATAHLRAGKSISQDSAKKCVTTEINRPEVQMLCALLWAQNQEENSFLEEIIIEKAQSNREWAIALFMQKAGLRNVSIDHLLVALQIIGNEPLPFVVHGLEYWLSQNKNQPSQNLKNIWNLISSRFQQQPTHLVSYLRLTWQLQRPIFQREFQKFCNIRTLRKAKWGCWKSLLFIEQDKNLPIELKALFRQQYPQHWNDPEWRHFRNFFPKTATMAQRILEDK